MSCTAVHVSTASSLPLSCCGSEPLTWITLSVCLSQSELEPNVTSISLAKDEISIQMHEASALVDPIAIPFAIPGRGLGKEGIAHLLGDQLKHSQHFEPASAIICHATDSSLYMPSKLHNFAAH